MMAQLKITALSLLGGMMLVGCGGTSLGDKVNLQLNQDTATAEFELSDGLEISLAGEFPVYGDLAKVVLTPATRTSNASISIEVDVSELGSDYVSNLPVVTTLPNGAPMPLAMMPPLFEVPVVEGDVAVDALVNISPELQVGAFIHIEQFKHEYFPAGISVCQNFRNGENVAFAAICLFGPDASGNPGGVFVGANFGDALDLIDRVIPQGNALMASNDMSKMSLSAPAIVAPQLVVTEPMVYESEVWSEERYDPKRKLSGSRGLKALRNAKKILRRR